MKWVFIIINIIVLGAFVAREHSHRSHHAAMAADLAAQITLHANTTTDLHDAQTVVKQLQNEQSQAEKQLQLLQDRADNLTLQRDHLRAEIERRQLAVELAEQNRQAIQARFEQAQQKLLDAQAEPLRLRSLISDLQERNGYLEDALALAGTHEANAPDRAILAGMSSDQRVFALSKPIRPDTANAADPALPVEVLLARGSRPLLRGVLQRHESGFLVGHVKEWLQPASALVKGEKLIMVYSHHHEAHP